MRLAGYAHLLRAAERLQWDERDVDLSADVVGDDLRAPLHELLAGFCVAEAAVAEHLAPFAAAAQDPALAACFAAQAVDEARHARFFARAARHFGVIRQAGAGDAALSRDPAGVTAADAALLRDANAAASPGLRELFGVELPRRAAALAAGGPLAPAVGLYHLVLEGIVFSVGQWALLDLLREAGTLPGLSDGARRVQEDERWHLGLGVAALDRLGEGDLELDAAVDLAMRAWGPAVRDRADLEHVARVHARRLELASYAPAVS